MKKIKIMTVFGTRPEAIKMAPLVLKFREYPEIEQIVCVTAQHRHMLDQVMDAFDIHADYDLDIMEKSQTLSSITARVLLGMDRVLDEAKPDIMLVHGDTSTTFAGALSAFYHRISVGHVEAGLRTYDKYSPYPEEINRRLVAPIADLHFAPTRSNRDHLVAEGICEKGIFITGNTVIDALSETVKREYIFKDERLSALDYDRERIILVTAHRRENYGRPLENIMTALLKLSQEFSDIRIVYPVHLSPVVQATAEKILKGRERIELIEPLDVCDMHNLMARAYMIMTDSGGIQEEAPALGKPVLVLRRETERPEAVEAGTAKLCGVEEAKIVDSARLLLSSQAEYQKMANAVNPYGDGNASARIAEAILWHFGMKDAKPADI